MNRAVLYARVSSELQQKERTIESQIEELKKQIAEAGDVLVKEYIDDGYSGAELDRPGMNELRNDLKTNIFDSVYFLNTDRIARDVTYQNIIIGEILKYKKQIIINGVDYIHNPENKFTLTVLGAVSELERAKIIERMTRGKMHRLNQGYLLGHGYNTYGYTYIRKTPEKPSEYVINEEEAKVVRLIYETYVKGEVGVNQITRMLEENGIPTREGRKLWNVSQIKYILKNESYAGIRYFHTRIHVKNTTNPLHKVKYGKKVYRDRSEWIGIKIPAIISRALYDKVKERLEYNLSRYRNPKRKQLLSNMLECGECSRRCFSYRRYYKKKMANGNTKIYHKAAYKCNSKRYQAMHAKNSGFIVCRNSEIATRILDACVLEMIEDQMLDAEKLRSWMEFFRRKVKASQVSMEKKLVNIDRNLATLEQKYKRLLDLYASGDLKREMYIQKNSELDSESNLLRANKIELLQQIPLLHKKEVVDISLAKYCEGVKEQFKSSTDFSTQREFLVQHIEKVIFFKSKVTIYGYVPIQLKVYQDPDQSSESSKIRFIIEKELDRNELIAKLKALEKSTGETEGTQITWTEFDQKLQKS
jgi:site-specific DNA recombinase